MAITLKRSMRQPTDHENLASVREKILAAAKEAKDAGRHDTLEVVLPAVRHTISEPIVLSAKENPELLSLDITIRGAYAGQAAITSLVRLDSKAFVKEEGKEYFTYQFEKKKGEKYPRFRDLFLNFRRIP